jgi:hypothetical protein
MQAEQTRLQNLAAAYADEWSTAAQAELTRLQNLAADAYAND